MALDTFVDKVHSREGISIPQLTKSKSPASIPLKNQIFNDPSKPISIPTMHHNFPISQELSTANIAEQMIDPAYKPIINHFALQPGKGDNNTFKGFTSKF